MDIGSAIEQMRLGKHVSRSGWNGKGMWLALHPGDEAPIGGKVAEVVGVPVGTVCRLLPFVMMRTAQGDLVPWLCSQTDLLATDWEIVS